MAVFYKYQYTNKRKNIHPCHLLLLLLHVQGQLVHLVLLGTQASSAFFNPFAQLWYFSCQVVQENFHLRGGDRLKFVTDEANLPDDLGHWRLCQTARLRVPQVFQRWCAYLLACRPRWGSPWVASNHRQSKPAERRCRRTGCRRCACSSSRRNGVQR